MLKFPILCRVITAITLVGLCSSSSPHAFSEEPRTSRRSKTGLVLAGGGALGMAHVGVLKVLEANRIPVDVITGTSIGSIVGAAYASGATINEMEEILSGTDWDQLFQETHNREDVDYRMKYGRRSQFLGDGKVGIKDDTLVRFSGIVSGQHVLPLLQRLYYRTPGDVNFDMLPIPFRALAADIETGEAVPIKSGELAVAARASMAVPGFFTPVNVNGKALVDGGIANNLPVDIAQQMGAERLIVVDLTVELKKQIELSGLTGITGQIISILLKQNSDLQRLNMRTGDILLEPNLKGFGATDFQKAKEIFARGEEVALEHVEELRRFSVSEEEYRRYQERREGHHKDSIVIAAVKIESDIEAVESSIEKRFEFQVGQPLDTAKVEEAIREEYKRGTLASLEYKIEKDTQGNNVLAVTAKKPRWYDQYMQFGFSLQDDFKGGSAYQLAFGARFNELNSAGAFLDSRLDIGWRPLFELDYYQPLARNSNYFINPLLSLDRYEVPVRVSGEQIAEYQRNRIIGGLGAGRKLGKSGEMIAGLSRGNGDFERTIGSPDLPAGSYQIGNYFGQLSIDSRDNPDFPREGTLFMYDVARHTEALGSSEDFTQMSGSAAQPLSFGSNTILLATDYGVSLDRIQPTRVFVLGGMLDLAGYQPGALAASDFVVGRLGYYRQLASLGGTFAKLNLFGGGTFEMASVRSDIEEIPDNTGIIAGMIFVGADTPIVPLFLAASMNNDDEATFYLNVGRIFRVRR